MTLDELLVGLGFDYDEEGLSDFKSDVGKTVDVVKKLATVALAGAAALTALTAATTAASDEQGKLADEVGESVENIDALEFAARRAGETSESVGNSIRQLAIRAAEAARGTGTGVEAFGILGITLTGVDGQLKSTSDLMLEVSGRMQGLDRARQIELADKLGLRDSIRLLQQGPKAIRELTAEAKALGVTTAEDAALSADFQDAMVDVWQITKSISRTITAILAPASTEMIGLFTEWWKVNRVIIEQNLPKWIEGFTKVLKLLSLALGAFISAKIVIHLIQLISLFRGVTLAALAMNAAVLLLPLLLGAAVAGLLLLLEDAKVFFEGGDSFIGDMIKRFPEWESEISVVAAVLATVVEMTTMIFDGWNMIFGLFKSEKGFMNEIKEMVDFAPAFIGDLLGIAPVGSEKGRALLPDDQRSSPIRGEFPEELLTPANNNIGIPTIISQLSTQAAASSPTIPVNNSSVQNGGNTMRVDRVEIKIEGDGKNSAEIGREVRDQFVQATQDLNTAVDQ